MPTTVAVRLGTADGSDEEIRRLARWLRDEDEFRGRVSLQNAPIQSSEMGGVVEAVVVGISAGAGPVFVQSLFDWLARRKEAGKVVLIVESADGNKISMECGSPEDAEKLLKALDDD